MAGSLGALSGRERSASSLARSGWSEALPGVAPVEWEGAVGTGRSAAQKVGEDGAGSPGKDGAIRREFGNSSGCGSLSFSRLAGLGTHVGLHSAARQRPLHSTNQPDLRVRLRDVEESRPRLRRRKPAGVHSAQLRSPAVPLHRFLLHRSLSLHHRITGRLRVEFFAHPHTQLRVPEIEAQVEGLDLHLLHVPAWSSLQWKTQADGTEVHKEVDAAPADLFGWRESLRPRPEAGC